AALRALLAEFSGMIQVAVLNACYSDEVGQEIENMAGCVVGMPGPVGDETARRFSEAFYAALFAGRSVRSAFNQAAVVYGLHAGNGRVRDVTIDAMAARSSMPVLRHRPDLDPAKLVIVAGGSSTQHWRRRSVTVLLVAGIAVAITAAAVHLSSV